MTGRQTEGISPQWRYLVVEGPIGSGKSALARRLAEHRGVHLLAEQPEANPFLARFHRHFPHHALATQLAFLMQRADSARAMIGGELFGQPLVSDFLFERDALFAGLNLDEEEQAEIAAAQAAANQTGGQP